MLDLAIVLGYLALTLVVGLWYSCNIKNLKDFSVSERKFSTPIIVATIFATMIGSASTVGFAEKIFTTGLSYMLIIPGVIIGYLFIAVFLAPKFAKFEGKISIGDIMEPAFGKESRIIAGIFSVLYTMGLLGAQISAMGYLFNYLFAMPYFFGVILGATVVIIYSYAGGVKAVTLTDVIQFGILIIAIPVICGVSLNYIGGYENLWSALPSKQKEFLPTSEGTMNLLSIFLIFLIPPIHPSAVQRLLMAKDATQIRTSITTVSLIFIPFFAIVAMIGLIALVLNPAIDPHHALFYLIDNILPIGIKGIAISGILAVIMSTIDSDLNAASIAITHDLFTPIFKKKKINELKVAKVATIILGVFSVLVAISFKSIFDLMISSKSLWLPIVPAPLIAAIFGLKIHKKAFFSAIIAGVASYLIWKNYLAATTGINPILIGFISNALVLLISHYIYTVRHQNPKFLREKFSTTLNPFFLIKKAVIKFWKLFNWSSITSLAEAKIQDNSMQYLAFSCFTIFSYVAPFFLWPYEWSDATSLTIALMLSAAIMCFILLLKDYWPTSIKPYLPIYWYCTLLFTLPFLTTFMLLENGMSIFSVVNAILAVFVLSLLVNWSLLLTLIPLGIILSTSTFFLLDKSIQWTVSYKTLIWTTYLYLFSIFAAVIFSRNREKDLKERLSLLKMLGGSIAHELRTPMTSILLGITAIKTKYLKPDAEPKVHDTLNRMESSANNSLATISMLLANLKFDQPSDKSILPISNCIQSAINDYPLSGNDNELINIDTSEDFNVLANQDHLRHVLWNLLKNALYQIKHNDRGQIFITTKVHGNSGSILFKDTAKGMSTDTASRVFEQFYSKTSGGTGLGLAFCKNAMEQHGGTISLNNIPGEYAEFVLTFPLKNN